MGVAHVFGYRICRCIYRGVICDILFILCKLDGNGVFGYTQRTRFLITNHYNITTSNHRVYHRQHKINLPEPKPKP